MTELDERTYERLASQAFARVLDLFEDVDPDDLDVEQAGDVLTLVSAAGHKLILNTQRPTRQLWLAGGRQAFHFTFDHDDGKWRDDKRPEAELFATLLGLVEQVAGVTVDAPA